MSYLYVQSAKATSFFEKRPMLSSNENKPKDTLEPRKTGDRQFGLSQRALCLLTWNNWRNWYSVEPMLKKTCMVMISSSLILLSIHLFGFSPTLVICVISGHIYPSVSIIRIIGWCCWKLVCTGWTWFTWSRTPRSKSRAFKSTVILTKRVTLNSFSVIEKCPSIGNLWWLNLLKQVINDVRFLWSPYGTNTV